MLKTFSLLFICSILIQPLIAQPYESIFGEFSASWNIYEEIADAGMTDSIFTGNDTLFNGFTYKYFTDTYGYKRGYLSEDTLSGKVWFYSINNETEYLAMDINLSIGDTFFMNPSAGTAFYAIVDSVFIQDDKKHIHLNYPLMYGADSLEFIEGVGPNAGINFQESNYGIIYSHLLCAQKDNVQTYTNSVFEGFCRYNWTAIDSRQQLPLSCRIYPNPFYEKAIITFNNTQKDVFSCCMYNSNMQVVYKRVDITDDHIVIERNNLLSGLYFINLINKQGFCITGTCILM